MRSSRGLDVATRTIRKKGKRGRVLGNEDVRPVRVLHSACRWINAMYDLAEVIAEGQAWHALRHTYARCFVEAGGRLEELQHSRGHSSIRTTETC